jgi:Flp pilus assembly protein TadD
MKRPELAAEAIKEAQNRAPNDAGVHRELGFLLLDARQAEAAVTRFRAAVELEPSSSEGWVGLVRALRESGHLPEADAALAQAPAEVRALFTEPRGP